MAADLGGASAAGAELRVDGGMTRNGLLMQTQADLLGRPVAVPPIAETSALGAAYAAGLAVGFWGSLDELRAMDRVDRRWEPAMDEPTRGAPASRAGRRAWHAASTGSTRRSSGCNGLARSAVHGTGNRRPRNARTVW